MKGFLKAEQVSYLLKKELRRPKLAMIRYVYLTERIKLLEEFINGKSK
jgi:hypothetical protein